jgi:choloylglycine hydrolase
MAVDLTGRKYYFRTYDNKNWRYVDLIKALQGAKGVQNISIEIPVDYSEVTITAK